VLSRNIAIGMVIDITGAMVAEAVGIRRGDTAHDGITHVELNGAGRLARTVVLPVEVQDRISAYLHEIPFPLAPEDPLFVGAWGGPLSPRMAQLAWEQMEDQLGLPRSTTPRGLRAGAVILMHRQGLLDYEIASRLGLKSVASVAQILSENGCYQAVSDVIKRLNNRRQPIDLPQI
jgi:site-specific recombinase XerC